MNFKRTYNIDFEVVNAMVTNSDYNGFMPVTPIRYIKSNDEEIELDVIGLFAAWVTNEFGSAVRNKHDEAMAVMKQHSSSPRTALIQYIQALCSSNIRLEEISAEDTPYNGAVPYKEFNNLKLYFNVYIKDEFIGTVHMFDLASSIEDYQAGNVIRKAISMDTYVMSFSFDRFNDFSLLDLIHPLLVSDRVFEWYIHEPATSGNMINAFMGFATMLEGFVSFLEFIKLVKKRTLQIKTITMSYRTAIYGANYNEDNDVIELSFAPEEYSVCIISNNDVYIEYYSYDNIMASVKDFTQKYKHLI